MLQLLEFQLNGQKPRTRSQLPYCVVLSRCPFSSRMPVSSRMPRSARYLYASTAGCRLSNRPGYCRLGLLVVCSLFCALLVDIITICGWLLRFNCFVNAIRYDTRCYFKGLLQLRFEHDSSTIPARFVRSKADMSRLNLPHGNDN